MDEVKDKFKQREALENAYSNFVEPHVNRLIEVKVDAATVTPVNPVFPICFYSVSIWLLLTVVYCLSTRLRMTRK